jgi:hypothetical protein
VRTRLLCLFLVFAGPAAAEDTLLARFVGDWVGNGSYRQNAAAEPERVYCKVANTLIDGGNTLQQKGRCAVASNTGAVDGTIEALGGNRYGGALDSLASVGPATISGVGAGNQIVIDADYIDTRTNAPTRSKTTLTAQDNGYTMVSEQTSADGSDFVSTEIVFTPQ